MKNFKKVISAVIALAMIVSSFTAVSASKFADVADTAKYAEAVEVLAALGIVEGTEAEGALVFQPEKEVARTEAVAMLVRALNMKDEAMSSTGTSQFADVNTQAAWAAGYVNVGVAQGFINGYDASTFGPLDNVTYAQLCKMLTCIAGYGEYAAAKGGWPTGYTSIAGEIGLSKGIAASATTALTKGQVAQMIYNTLTTPKLGVYLYAAAGNSYTQLDGINGNDFATLLSEKFGGYAATVLITDTPVSNTELELDEVKFDVTKAAYWPEITEPITAADEAYPTKTLYAGDADVNSNNLQSGKAVFVTNEDDELVMVYFKANGKTETKELAADTYVLQDKISPSNQYASDNKKIKFGSSYYKLANSVDVYVNGSLFETLAIRAAEGTEGEDDYVPAITAATVRDRFDAIIGGAQGTVKLVKEGDANYYTSIFVDYYQIAKVSAVDVEEDEITVSLSGTKAAIGEEYDEIIISTESVEEGKTVVSVTKNGAEASLEDLKKGDIIAYATDFANETDLEDPKVLVVIATDDTATGTVSKVKNADNKYTIGGTVYSKTDAEESMSALALKNSLVLTLDPFGRIYTVETDGTSAKYAIALRVTSNDEVVLLLADGTQKTYEASNNVDVGAIETAIDNEADVTDRVVEYTVKGSTGELNSVVFVNDATALNADYKARTGKLGANTVSDTTAIIDATKIETARDAKTAGNYATVSKDALIDGTNYQGIVIKDGTYVSFILLTNIGTTFGESSRFAVAQSNPILHATDDGDDCYLVIAMNDGKADEELLFNTNLFDDEGDDDVALAAGDAFFYEVDAYGFIEKVHVVAKVTDEDGFDFDGFADGVVETGVADGWSYNLVAGVESIQLTVGAVVEVTDKYITLADVADIAESHALNTNNDLEADEDHGIVTYTLADDYVSYYYDINDDDAYEEEDKFFKRDAKPSKIEQYEDEDDKGVYAGIAMEDVYEALVMIVDGDIVAIYEIVK